jgi:hypothetical protein
MHVQHRWEIKPKAIFEILRIKTFYSCGWYTDPLHANIFIRQIPSIQLNYELRITIHTDSRSDRRSFEKPPKCDGRYVPGSVSYNLSISWTIKDPLVLEAVDEYSVSLTPLHSSLNLNFLAQSTRESFEVRRKSNAMHRAYYTFSTGGADWFCVLFQPASWDRETISINDGTLVEFRGFRALCKSVRIVSCRKKIFYPMVSW